MILATIVTMRHLDSTRGELQQCRTVEVLAWLEVATKDEKVIGYADPTSATLSALSPGPL